MLTYRQNNKGKFIPADEWLSQQRKRFIPADEWLNDYSIAQSESIEPEEIEEKYEEGTIVDGEPIPFYDDWDNGLRDIVYEPVSPDSDQIEPNDHSSELIDHSSELIDHSSELIDHEEYDPDKYTDWIEFEEEFPPTIIKPEKKQDPYETYLLERKWVLIYLTEGIETTISIYKEAISVYLYLKGKISTPLFTNREFIKQLYKEIPYLQSILFTDRHWNKDPNKPWQEVTTKMRWKMVYDILVKGKLRDLYEQWEHPPVQLALALGV